METICYFCNKQYNNKMEREIFISYSRRNNKIVSKIKAEIEKATGANCWMDLEGIESGSSKFDEVIVNGIKKSKVFLFMLSKESQNSKFAINELEFAKDENNEGADKKIVLVNVDDCKMEDVFRFRYSRMDIIDWNKPEQHDKLIRDLKKWVGGKKEKESDKIITQQQNDKLISELKIEQNNNEIEQEIFISYSYRNLDRVSAIKEEIENVTGANCLMDLGGIVSGIPEYDEVIVNGIMKSKVFLFMLSKESQKSEYAIRELEFARRKMYKDKNYKIVLINIDDCEITDDFYQHFNGIDIIDWNDTAQHDKLIRDLKKWVGTNNQQGSISKKPQSAPPPKATSSPKRQLVPTLKAITIKPWVIGAAVAAVAIIMATIGIVRGCDTPAPQEPLNQTPLSNRTFTVNGVQFTMVGVTGGTFQMGSNDGKDWEKPVHSVTLSSYYIGQTEVTQALWKAVMGSNPSGFKGDDLPVENVSWCDCQEFITKLNELTGEKFRLPTEAEWEFAAKGGNKSKGYTYSGGNEIDDLAWHYYNSSGQTHPVGTKMPNELGIYDMSGNVWEWCQDWYGVYSSETQTNPAGPASGSGRVPRGGSYPDDATGCRAAYRVCGCAPTDTSCNLGFRLALSK